MRPFRACAILFAATSPLLATHQSWTNSAGTVGQTATTLTISGASLASPGGSLDLSCDLTPITAGYGYSSEWSCTGGIFNLKSADGAIIYGSFASGVFTLSETEVNRTFYYNYALYANYSASQRGNGTALAVAGAVTETLTALTSPLTAVTGTVQSGTVDEDQQYEPLFIADTGNNRIVKASDILGSNWDSLGTAGSGVKQFSSPWGVAVDSAGKIYVSDSGNCRIVRMDNILGTNWTSYGACGAGPGQFSNPEGLWVDASGRIYVADTGNNRIVRVDDITGTNFTALGSAGSGTAQFSSPAAVTTDSGGNIYVADTANARVVEFSDMLGTNWAVWQFPLNYLTPDGVSVDSTGKIYTTDSLQNQVIRADNITGVNEASLNVNYLLYLNGVEAPSGIFVDPDRAIYIADTNNNRIDRLFDLSYENQMVLGTAGAKFGNLSHPHAAVTMTKTGPVEASAVTPSVLTFPTELEGVASPAETIVLSNIGRLPFTFNSITSSSPDFQIVSDVCSAVFAAGEHCDVIVAFQPTAGGLRKGSLNFALRDAPSKSVFLIGSGALITIAPTELILFEGQGGTVTVTNPLTTSAAVKSVKMIGNFRQKNNCGTLAPGASCTINVTWNYTGFVITGTMEITDSAGTVQYVSITGE